MRGTASLTIGIVASLAACAADPNYGTGSAGTSGGAGTTGSAGAGGAAGAYVPPALTVHANPIISRGKPVFSSPANGSAVVNGAYHNGGWTAPAPTPDAPAWVAIHLGPGPTRILVSWDDGGTYDYFEPNPSTTVYGLPSDYHFEVSPDDSTGGAVSTNGSDGTWKVVDPLVTGNKVRTRAHAFDFTGKEWVKMVITGKPATESGNGVQIGEIDVHDLTPSDAGVPDDSWFFMGDSITAFAYDRAAVHQPSFAAAVHAAAPSFFPAMINGGIGSERTSDGLARLANALSINSDYHFFVLGYGTNDAAGGQIPIATFQSNLQTMIDMIKAAGHEPIVPHIPYAGDGGHGSIPAYNAVIDTLTRTNRLQKGPDLYSYFMQHPEQFTCPPCAGRPATDNLHPNDDGLAAMNQLWADAVAAFYQ